MSSGFPGFPKEMVQFFRSLKRNNRREWFQPRKGLYEQHVKGPMQELVEALNAGLGKFAPQYVTDPKKAIFRIYRDTRFSPNKTPYKTNIAAVFSWRGPALGTGGFYFSVSTEEIEVAGGIYRPLPETMFLVRSHIAESHPEMRRILANRKARRLLGELQGDELTRAPKGFDPSHPALDLIKKKDWLLDVTLPPGLATSPQLYREILNRFEAMAPLIDYLNRPLVRRKPARDSLEFRF